MVKILSSTHSGSPIAILGLTKEDTKRLLKGKPLLVNLRELGVLNAPVLVIVGGGNDDAIRADLNSCLEEGASLDESA